MDDDSDSPPPRRPTRHVPSRQAKVKTLKTPARETRSTAAYFTGSTTSSLTSPASTEAERRTSPRNLRPLRAKRKSATTSSRPSSHTKSTKRQRIQPSEPSDRRTPSLLRRHQAQSENAVDDTPLDDPAVFPPWHTLPYHVWLRVFDFVATPIRDPGSRIEDLAEAVASLVSGSRTCKATAEPALAALYRCPPFNRIYNKSLQSSFVQFLRTLETSPSETLIRYRPKVEILRIDVETVLARKANGLQLQLQQVLRHLPRLACLELYHPADDPPYRDLDSRLRWRVSKDDLLVGLGPCPDDGDASASDKTAITILKSWRWNSRLVPEDLSLDRLSGIHSLPSFRGLRKVAFVNYQLPSTTESSVRARSSQKARDRDAQAIADLAASISALPDLQHLVIESSTLANGALLERLPKTLTHLELVNCWEITSEDFTTFLISHGHSLVRLTLNHCQALSLSFLPILGSSCPNLAHLEVDLSYFRHHESYADNKPDYATLLDVNQVPVWPPSIQSIQIAHMRNWTREAAEMFFGSLMKNAKKLPNLRRLEFKVILNIEWRQRQEMRRSLADQMTRVFKRNSSPPKEQRTLRQDTETDPNALGGAGAGAGTRRSTRIADQSFMSTSNRDDGSSTAEGAPSKVLRVRKSLKSFRSVSTFDADDEGSSEDELSLSHAHTRRSRGRTMTAKEAGLRGDEFIHGFCDYVDIQVDNQRPAERQYDMDDFLDAPQESDPEWNSDEDEMFT